MNLDDESHLSAYLDDELDPADRLAVEWSIESSPRQAEQLRSIALTRDAVAGLDRPAIPRDLAPVLGVRIASNRRRARRLSPTRVALTLSGFAGFSAIAASLIFALILLHQSLHPTADRPIAVVQHIEPAPAPAPRTHSIDPSVPESVPAPASAKLVQNVKEILPEPPVAPPVPPGEAAERDDRRVIGGILGRSHVRRIVIVTDIIDASEKVRALIAQGGRETPEFGRISISQEIVIDPDHAEAAEIFAVPIDERGRRSFVDLLQRTFPDLIEEGQSSPELVTQLTEVGQVAVFRGLKAAPLGDPPHDLPGLIANREREHDPFVIEADRPAIDTGQRERPGPAKRFETTKVEVDRGQPPTSQGSQFVGPPDLDRKAPPKPGERVTLLVWVTRPNRH
jgi:anti-sigma factor RsiW